MDPPLEGLREAVTGVGVADALRLAILDGTLAPGTRLLQPQIAQVFGISRTPVREALHKLNGWGLVDLIVNHAAVVRRVPRNHYESAFVVWGELASLAVELALEHGGDVTERLRFAIKEEWTTVDAATASTRPAADAARRWIAAQEAFHGALLDESGSTRLRETIGTTTDLLRWETMWKVVGEHPYPLRCSVLRHEEIVVLMRRRESAAAESMRQHISELGDAFLAWFDRTLGDGSARSGA